MLNRWQKEPVLYYYRKFAVSKIAVTKTNNMNTHSLFAGTHPTRVYLALVESTKSAGTQDSSPFEFYRKWTYTPKSELAAMAINSSVDKYGEMQELLYNFMIQQQDENSTRKGKKLQKQSNKSLLERAKKLFNKDLDDGVSSTSSRLTSNYEPIPGPSRLQGDTPAVPVAPTTTKKTVYLTKLQLTLDGTDLGNKKRSLTL